MEQIKNYEVNSERWTSLENYEGEIWKELPEYEGLYQISNYGRIKRIPRNDQGLGNRTLAKIRKYNFDKDGYCVVVLSKDGIKRVKKVHRLVLETFLPNSEQLPMVNHKDEDKTNNRLSNLEWCTAKYNCNYGTALERTAKKLTNRTDCSISVLCFNLKGVMIREYPSISEVKRTFGKNVNHIYKVISHGGGYANGYVWIQKENIENLQNILNKRYSSPKEVVQLTMDFQFVNEFKNAQEASRTTGICSNNIRECCRHEQSYAKGYRWLFKDEYEQSINR